MFDIRDFGAIPGARCEKAIQSAIDAASAAGGGTVWIPGGRYESANIQLKSNVTLHLDAGAVLAASPDFRDYAFTKQGAGWAGMAGLPTSRKACGFLWAENAKNLRVEGEGTIDGRGAKHEFFPSPDDPDRRRPHLLLLMNCEDISVSGVTMRDPAMFTFYAVGCMRVRVDGVSIFSRETENGDGVDFDGSSDVTVTRCLIDSGDDAISLKTTDPTRPCLNYAISDCVFHSIWSGIRLGTESSADMREIAVTNCVFDDCADGLKIQVCAGGTYENLRVSNCVMRNVHRPLFLTRSSYRLAWRDESVRPKPGALRGVVLSGITAYVSEGGEDYKRNGFVVSGTPEFPVEDLTLRDVRVVFGGGGRREDAKRVDVPEYLDASFLYPDVFSINGRFPCAGPFLRHIRGLRTIDCRFETASPDERPMIWAQDVTDWRARGVEALGECAGAGACVDCEADFRDGNFDSLSPLSAQDEARYRDFVRASEQADRRIGEWARGVDEAERMPGALPIPLEGWTKGEGAWSARVHLPGKRGKLLLWLQGDARVYANGALVGDSTLDARYRNLVLLPCDVPSGDALIEVKWLDPSQKSGADCLLPFGEFRPFGAVLTQDAVYRYE